MQRDPLTKKTSFAGYTFTPLHCDLADAVNYCCYGEQATWTIFRRSDRDSESPWGAQPKPRLQAQEDSGAMIIAAPKRCSIALQLS